jgi:hypothetical protein
MSADWEMDVISHAAPTDCMFHPKFETMFADHTARNIGMRKGDSAETGWASFAVWAIEGGAP